MSYLIAKKNKYATCDVKKYAFYHKLKIFT